MIIYFDMDGVLIDFDKAINDFSLNPGSNIPSSELNGQDLINRKKFWNDVEYKYPDIYNHMGVVDGIDLVFEHLENLKNDGFDFELKILSNHPSSSSVSEEYIEKVKQMKCDQINKFFKDKFNEIIVTEVKKHKFIKNPTDVLVDDRLININRWEDNNGVGVLFTTIDNLIDELSKIIKKG